MTDQEINARCAALAGIPEGQAFDAINNEDDLAKVIIKQSGGDVDLSAFTASITNELNAKHAALKEVERVAKVQQELPALFRRAAAAAYAALPA